MSYLYPNSNKSFHVRTIMNMRKETDQENTKIGVGNSLTMKVRETDEKSREGKIRMTRKELVGWM